MDLSFVNRHKFRKRNSAHSVDLWVQRSSAYSSLRRGPIYLKHRDIYIMSIVVKSDVGS